MLKALRRDEFDRAQDDSGWLSEATGPERSSSSRADRAMPKSTILTWSAFVGLYLSMMLPGFRSRWNNPT